MEGSELGRRLAARTEEAQVDGLVSRGRGRGRRLSKAYFVAARRLPLRFTADHPASDALVAASLFATPWDLPAPAVEGEASPKRKFKAYPIGYFYLDIAEVRTAEGNLYLLVAIDRTSKFAVVELHEKVARRTAGDFLRRLIAAVPYQVHTVLTDNGAHFATPGNTSSAAPDIKAALDAGEPVWAHAFEYACAQNDIDQRLTTPKHPWTTDVIDKCFFARSELFFSCAQVTARRRAGREAQALPRSLHCRTSFAASVRARFGPRGFQPATNRA